ncbi:transporter [Oscillatoriales cyanobacterium USR001]|nr:transporter [Oscillatoriales cyanobacterium USR001]
MSRKVFLVLIAAILCGVIGQFSLKAAANNLGPIGAANLVEKAIAMANQPLIWLGLVLYGFGAFGFIIVLSHANISIVSPLLSISYICVVLGGKFIFNEPLPPLRLIGVSFIMAGVVFVLNSSPNNAAGGG